MTPQTTLFSQEDQIRTGIKEVHDFPDWKSALEFAQEQHNLEKWKDIVISPPRPDGSRQVIPA